MFAAALEECGFRRDWVYEPEFLFAGEWIVDFALPIVTDHRYFQWQAIEYKPKRPTDTYLRELALRFTEIEKRESIVAWCVWVDWHSIKEDRFDWGALRLTCGEWQEQRRSYGATTLQLMPPFCGAHPDGFRAVANMRFDLSVSS